MPDCEYEMTALEAVLLAVNGDVRCGHRSRFFYEAEVSPDNHTYKAIDGSIFTADEKTLIHVKISNDGYKVPDGTETIAKDSLSDVSVTVCIPASVTKIEDEYVLGREITAGGVVACRR